MFWCVIKSVYEEMLDKGYSNNESIKAACYNSMEMKSNWSIEQIEEFNKNNMLWDCSGIKNIKTDKKKVSYINEHNRAFNDSFYYVRSFFRLGNGEKLTYKSSDDKHTIAQHILAGLILSKEKIKINYRDIPFYLNEIDIDIKKKTVDHVLEQSYIDNNIGVNRKADLLFELKNPNLTFGKGFVFEITNTESQESIENKSKDWAKAGYTLISVPINNFDFENYGLKNEPYFILYRLFDDLNLYLNILKKIKDNEPLIDNFNKNIKEMEIKNFLWKSGFHNYDIMHDEKIDSILLYCMNYRITKYKSSKRAKIIQCYDYKNRLFEMIIWDSNPLFNKINECDFIGKLIKLEYAFFKSFRNDINIYLTKFSKIKEINFEEVLNANKN